MYSSGIQTLTWLAHPVLDVRQDLRVEWPAASLGSPMMSLRAWLTAPAVQLD